MSNGHLTLKMPTFEHEQFLTSHFVFPSSLLKGFIALAFWGRCGYTLGVAFAGWGDRLSRTPPGSSGLQSNNPVQGMLNPKRSVRLLSIIVPAPDGPRYRDCRIVGYVNI